MPPLTLENASALVSGGVSAASLKEERKSMATVAAQPLPPKTLTGTVERAFYFQGRVLNKGEKHELPRVFALEMEAAHKFKVDEPPAAPAAAAESASQSETEAKSQKVKGGRNVG